MIDSVYVRWKILSFKILFFLIFQCKSNNNLLAFYLQLGRDGSGISLVGCKRMISSCYSNTFSSIPVSVWKEGVNLVWKSQLTYFSKNQLYTVSWIWQVMLECAWNPLRPWPTPTFELDSDPPVFSTKTLTLTHHKYCNWPSGPRDLSGLIYSSASHLTLFSSSAKYPDLLSGAGHPQKIREDVCSPSALQPFPKEGSNNTIQSDTPL